MKTILPFLVFVALGCAHGSDDGMTAADTKLANDVDTWAKDAGGDWSKLSTQRQQRLIQSAGSEATAKKVFEMKGHPPTSIAPGKPATPVP